MRQNKQGRWCGVGTALLMMFAIVLTPRFAVAEEAVSLRTATENVLKVYGGEVLKADEVMRDGQRAYRIRLIANGRVKEYFIDPHNGAEVAPHNFK